jgi:hypothetical protein
VKTVVAYAAGDGGDASRPHTAHRELRGSSVVVFNVPGVPNDGPSASDLVAVDPSPLPIVDATCVTFTPSERSTARLRGSILVTTHKDRCLCVRVHRERPRPRERRT